MAKSKKLTKQQQANKKEYNRLRDNLKRRMKRFSDKGYYVKAGYIEKIKLPSITELGHNPVKRDIEKLKTISSKYINEAFYKTFYSETGQPKEFSLSKARNIERSRAAKKSASTRKFYKKYPQFKEYKNYINEKSKNDNYIKKLDKPLDNFDYDDFETTDFYDQSYNTENSSKTEDEMYKDISIEKTDDGLKVYKDGELFEPAVDENGEIIGWYPDLSDLPFLDDDSDTESESDEFPTEYVLPLSEDKIKEQGGIYEHDVVINNLNEALNEIEFQIKKLFGFKSKSQNKDKAKQNENFVTNIAEDILEEFKMAKHNDAVTLSKICQLRAGEILALIDKVRMSYLDPATAESITTDLADIFNSENLTFNEAVQISSDSQYETGGEHIYD